MRTTIRAVRIRPALTGLAVAGIATLALAACGNSGGVGGGQDAKQDTSGGKVTINYETWYPDQKTLQTAIDGFEKQNPNITVKLRVLTAQAIQQQLPLQLNGGESIDVAGVQVSAMTNTVKSQLRPVSSWSNQLPGDWRSKLNSKLLDQAQQAASDDKLYDIPMGGVASAFMYYNNSILKKAGISAPPKTTAELASDVAKIKKTDPSVTTPVAFIGDGWWQEEMLFSFAGQHYPNLSESIIDGKASWNQPDLVNSLSMYKSAFQDGAFSPSALSLTGTAATSLLTSDKAAFLIDGSWGASILSSNFRKENNITASDFGATTVPLADGGTPAVRSFAEGGMAIPRSSTHVAAAAKFIAYMTYGDGVDIWNKNLVYLPVAKKGWTPPSGVLTTAAAKQGFADISAAAAAPGSIRDSQQDFLNSVEGPDILDVLRGTMTAPQAAAAMQTAWISGRYPHK